MKKFAFIFPVFFFYGMASVLSQVSVATPRTAYADQKGVIRWSDSKQEVALFGANYCLPSSCDYRAAGYLGKDRKRMVDEDMAHFARMKFDALRLCLWGDYENTDSIGNLIDNDHLQLMDYVVYKAKERGVYMLLSPITTYSSLFPDQYRNTDAVKGSLSATYKKSELGTNPKAIAAQCRYLTQLLNHVNPYTRMALKDDPSIIFVEMINEPQHHSNDVEGSVRYINALVDAVRSTGCKKVLFHNVSQDFEIAKAMGKSKIQGASFAWYPSGLNSGRTIPGNFLPVVDKFSDEMRRPELSNLGRIVYEFDTPDLLNGYLYPAMARSFREVGAQWATMFSYDMMGTASHNLGWQTHYLNMVYTPQKAISAVIAAEVMRNIPMYKKHGKYPANTSFGPFRINYEQNLGEMNTVEKFYYTDSTTSGPLNPAGLKAIIGYHSSPVVKYDGRGVYFLDKLKEGLWRLEVYPDALPVDDPFRMPSPDKQVTRIIYRQRPMQVNLPDLGNSFHIKGVNKGNNYNASAVNQTFNIKPGVYLLSVTPGKIDLPPSIGAVNMTEFVAPEPESDFVHVVSPGSTLVQLSKDNDISAEVFTPKQPDEVALYYRPHNIGRFKKVVMKNTSEYCYKANLAFTPDLTDGLYDYCVVVKSEGKKINFPSKSSQAPDDWNYSGNENWQFRIVTGKHPLPLFSADADAGKLAFTRLGDNIRFGLFKMVTMSEDGSAAIRLELPLNYDKDIDDYTVSYSIKDKISGIQPIAKKANSIIIDAKNIGSAQETYITLVERDGTSWSARLPVTTARQLMAIKVADLKPGRGVMLPLGYPGRWPYWFIPAEGRGGAADRVKVENVESVQISVRPADKTQQPSASYLEVGSIALKFDDE